MNRDPGRGDGGVTSKNVRRDEGCVVWYGSTTIKGVSFVEKVPLDFSFLFPFPFLFLSRPGQPDQTISQQQPNSPPDPTSLLFRLNFPLVFDW